jgi:hypothetical protein
MIFEYAFSNVLCAFANASDKGGRRRRGGGLGVGGEKFAEAAHLCRSASSLHGLNGSSPTTARDIFLFFLSTAFAARADNLPA